MSIGKCKLAFLFFCGIFGTHPALAAGAISPTAPTTENHQIRPEEGRKRTAPAEPGRLQTFASLVFLHALRQDHKRQQEEE